MSVARLSFRIYENWQAGEHKARIHRSTCSWCNDGAGIRPEAGDEHGRWIPAPGDPTHRLDSYARAYVVASQLGGDVRVSPCQHCAPHLDSH